MAKEINLTSQKWIDIIFEGKNKNYGAYVLRKESSKRHLTALLVTLVFTSLTFLFASISNKTENNMQQDPTRIVSTLGDYELDKPKEPEKPKPIKIENPINDLAKTIKFTKITIKENNLVKPEQDVPSQSKLIDDPTALIAAVSNPKGRDDGLGIDPNDIQKNNQITNTPEPEKEIIVDVVEINPTFPGGPNEMYAFLKRNIVYPTIAQENNIQGTVVCQFVVGKDGTINDINVVRGVDQSLDKEAVRLIKSMPKWIPGKQGGVAVKVRFTLPIIFKLQN